MNYVLKIDAVIDRQELKAGESTTVAFDVNNLTSQSPRGMFQIVSADGATSGTWFQLQGDAQRYFSAHETQRLVFAVTVPAGTKAGRYLFRLRGATTAGGQDVTESALTELLVTMPPAAVPAPAPVSPLPGTISRLERWALLGVAIVLFFSLVHFVKDVPVVLAWPVGLAVGAVLLIMAWRKWRACRRPGCTVEQIWGKRPERSRALFYGLSVLFWWYGDPLP